ncbi:MAG: phospholipase D-like domain-containing protein, partial [Planctomycetota bacterium]|nr:phospholipase D-like domain-containing protein [Planctomycetota bacterium]
AARLRAQGVDGRAALPVTPLRRQLERMDLRNHRKLAVIDARAALTGSQNIVNADYGQTRVGAWRDMTVLVRGPVIAQLQAIFRADWHFETGEVIGQEEIDEDWTPRGEIAVQAAPSGPTYGTDAAHRLIVAAVQEANERLIITSPYFVPDEAFILAIELAVLRGVQVDLVVPERANHPLVQAAGRAFYGTILEAGARIHLHQTGLLHAKTLSVDDAFALVGSANFDIRSFFLNFELNLLLYGRQAAEALRKRQMEYIAESRLLSKDVWLKRPGWRRTADDLAKLCSPLL